MVYLFLATGFEEIEALTPVDILRRGGLNVCTVSLCKTREVVGAHNIPVTADLLMQDFLANQPDLSEVSMFILPGGMPGAANLRACVPLCEMLETLNTHNVPIGAICAAPFILGQLGILKGRSATCYPGFEDRLIGAKLSDQKVVRDGNILTAAGMGVAAEFSLAALEMLSGSECADRVAKSVLFDGNRWRNR